MKILIILLTTVGLMNSTWGQSSVTDNSNNSCRVRLGIVDSGLTSSNHLPTSATVTTFTKSAATRLQSVDWTSRYGYSHGEEIALAASNRLARLSSKCSLDIYVVNPFVVVRGRSANGWRTHGGRQLEQLGVDYGTLERGLAWLSEQAVTTVVVPWGTKASPASKRTFALAEALGLQIVASQPNDVERAKSGWVYPADYDSTIAVSASGSRYPAANLLSIFDSTDFFANGISRIGVQGSSFAAAEVGAVIAYGDSLLGTGNGLRMAELLSKPDSLSIEGESRSAAVLPDHIADSEMQQVLLSVLAQQPPAVVSLQGRDTAFATRLEPSL